MNEPALFDASTLQHQECAVPHCGAILSAGQTPPIISCAHDLDPERKRRPRLCLNRAPDPATVPWPEGF